MNERRRGGLLLELIQKRKEKRVEGAPKKKVVSTKRESA